MNCAVKVGDKVPRRGNVVSAFVGRCLLRLIGWRVVGELPNSSKAVVIGAPHTSNRDGLVAAATILSLRVRISIMAKHTLFRGPFGFFFRFLGGIPIERSKGHGVVDLSVQEFNQRDELFLGLAPEGTRDKAEKWKMGFYRIAFNAGVPVVATVLDYGTKTVFLTPAIEPSGDMEADMKVIIGRYHGAIPARPERLSQPLRNA